MDNQMLNESRRAKPLEPINDFRVQIINIKAFTFGAQKGSQACRRRIRIKCSQAKTRRRHTRAAGPRTEQYDGISAKMRVTSAYICR